MHETRGAVHLLHGVRGDVHVEFVVRGVVVRGGRARSRARALGAPTADGDQRSAALARSLLGSTAGADDQTDERVPGVFSRGDVHAQLARGRAVVSRGFVRGIERAQSSCATSRRSASHRSQRRCSRELTRRPVARSYSGGGEGIARGVEEEERGRWTPCAR